tara:strand:- start:305 stop:451 length:147 start_codon:yes stop_codon:yes gene_type:complete
MQDEVMILAKLVQLKDTQIFLLKEEEKLKAELARLKKLESERNEIASK